MSGQEVIAEIRAQGAETRALIGKTNAEIHALLAETRAGLRAEIALGVEANTARPDAVGWNVTATLGLVLGLVAAGLLHWITGHWADSRGVRNEVSG